MARVYLETSFIIACIVHSANVADAYRRARSLEWWNKCRLRHQVYTAVEALQGLNGSADGAQFREDVSLLAGNPEASGLAELLTQERIADNSTARHVALAVAHRMDYMLTWDVRRLASPTAVERLHQICLGLSLLPPCITTPDFLWDDSVESDADPLIDEVRTIRAASWSGASDDPAGGRSS